MSEQKFDTIRDRIEDVFQQIEPKKRQAKAERLARLEELEAPEVIMAGIREELAVDVEDAVQAELKKVGHLKDYGHLAYVEEEKQEYRRGLGITFRTVDGQRVKFIPGPYSWFLTTDK